MIFAVIIFIATDDTRAATYRSVDNFPTIAACQAHLDADMPRLDAVRAQAEARLGYPLRMVARCVDQRGVAL